MCGIVSVYSTERSGMSKDLAAAFRDLLVLDSIRGFDSTGYFREDIHGKCTYLKEAVTGADFVQRNIERGWGTGCRYLVGHNRAATVGAVTAELAHPFNYDNVIGVHNGTIANWRFLFDDADQKVESDTAKLYSALSVAEDDFDSVVKVLDDADTGAYALIWRDARTNSLRITRNEKRPLYMAEVTDGVIIASEGTFIDFVIARHELKRVGETFAVKPHVLLNLPLDGESKATADEYTTLGYEPYSYPTYQTSSTPYRPKGAWSAYSVNGIESFGKHYGTEIAAGLLTYLNAFMPGWAKRFGGALDPLKLKTASLPGAIIPDLQEASLLLDLLPDNVVIDNDAVPVVLTSVEGGSAVGYMPFNTPSDDGLLTHSIPVELAETKTASYVNPVVADAMKRVKKNGYAVIAVKPSSIRIYPDGVTLFCISMGATNLEVLEEVVDPEGYEFPITSPASDDEYELWTCFLEWDSATTN